MTANDNSLSLTSRSGSQQRARQIKIPVSCDATEFVIIDEQARRAGLSRPSYLRTLALGSPGPRAKRAPHVNAEALAHATGALNRVGSLLNQIARVLNSGGSATTTLECYRALREVRQAVDQILEIVGRKERV